MATETETVQQIREEYKYGFSNPDEAKDYFFKSGRGISHEVVEAIAEHKNEPDWMRKFRHKSLDYFLARPLPTCSSMRPACAPATPERICTPDRWPARDNGAAPDTSSRSGTGQYRTGYRN
jgi:hypothetical protein